MKLTDDERRWVENQNRIWDDVNQCFYVDETVEKLLKSEQAAWEAAETQKNNNLSLAWEVKRLKEENERLAKRAQLSKEDAEHFASIGFEFSEQIKLLENQLQDALNTLKWYADGDNWIGQCTDVEIDKGWNAQQAIDRIQEGIQG